MRDVLIDCICAAIVGVVFGSVAGALYWGMP